MLCKAGAMDRGDMGDGLVVSVVAELPLCDMATASIGSQRANSSSVICILGVGALVKIRARDVVKKWLGKDGCVIHCD